MLWSEHGFHEFLRRYGLQEAGALSPRVTLTMRRALAPVESIPVLSASCFSTGAAADRALESEV
jgi:hypothetical protein